MQLSQSCFNIGWIVTSRYMYEVLSECGKLALSSLPSILYSWRHQIVLSDLIYQKML